MKKSIEYILFEIIKGLKLLKKKYKVSSKIRITECFFKLKLSNGDTMTYISLDLYDISEKIKKYLEKKYNIMAEEYSNFIITKNEKIEIKDILKNNKFNLVYDNSKSEDCYDLKIYKKNKTIFSNLKKEIMIEDENEINEFHVMLRKIKNNS